MTDPLDHPLIKTILDRFKGSRITAVRKPLTKPPDDAHKEDSNPPKGTTK